jgi:hypothetical protein
LYFEEESQRFTPQAAGSIGEEVNYHRNYRNEMTLNHVFRPPDERGQARCLHCDLVVVVHPGLDSAILIKHQIAKAGECSFKKWKDTREKF